MMMVEWWTLTPIEEIPPVKRASHMPPGVLRKCIDCGTEALNEMDLEKFVKRKEAPHGRANICKDCRNARTRIGAWRRS